MRGVADILRRIVDRRRTRIDTNRRSIRSFLDQAPPNPLDAADRGGQLLRRLGSRSGRAIVAEVKMGSPSLGRLEGLDAEGLARAYADAGAAALSVVTEPDFFFGSYEMLHRCQHSSGLPALAKDFIVDPIQIELAAHAGASACLLIATLHSRSELLDLAGEAERFGLVPLIECHSPEDVVKLGENDWSLVGVNNRDLHSFEVDLDHSRNLVASLPDCAIKVAESGISSRQEIELLAAAGFDAFLIGEAFVKSEDPGRELRSLLGVSL